VSVQNAKVRRQSMGERYGTIQVKRMRGELVLIGMGKTGRGQSYIKRRVPMEAKNIRSKSFKGQLTAAVAKLYESEA
jgi:hypothetical protein